MRPQFLALLSMQILATVEKVLTLFLTDEKAGLLHSSQAHRATTLPETVLAKRSRSDAM